MKSIPLTRTKLLVPRRPRNLLPRPRLLDLLYDLLDHRLILVTAPAGYGKTSLLTELAHDLAISVCWYALDELDRDPQRFAVHLVAAIAQQFPDFGETTRAVLHGTPLDAVNLDAVVRVLVNDVYDHVREHFVLVLDDFHLVQDVPLIERFVSQFVQHVDETCHLILAARTLLSLPDLPLMIARSQVGGLGFEDLAFRPEEIQALMLRNYGLTLPDDAAATLAESTEGWITGLLLSAGSMWQGMTDRVRLARVSGVGLYEYLAQQILDQQPPHIRHFLLRSALLETFDAELCATVLGPNEDWAARIQEVVQRNLFVQELDAAVRYHHLFRDFLRQRMMDAHPAEAHRILRRLADDHARRAAWENAHALYRRLEDDEAIAVLLERAGSPMIKSGRVKTLDAWLDALPPETLAAHPRLLSVHGAVAWMLGDTDAALHRLDRAVTALRQSDAPVALARTLVRRAAVYQRRGPYERALQDTDAALALLEEHPDALTVRAEALRAKGLSLHWMGRLGPAVQWLERALDAYTALEDEPSQMLVLMELGLAQMNAGRYAQAMTYYQRALAHGQQDHNLARQATLHNNLGVLYHLLGQLEEAVPQLEEAVELARRSGYRRMAGLALAGLGDLYMELDAWAGAETAYAQAQAIAQRSDDRFLLLYGALAQGALARRRGDVAQAAHHLARARRHASAGRSDYEQGLFQREAGRQALARSDPDAAAHLEAAAHHFTTGGLQIEAAGAHLLLAAALGGAAASKHLTRAFALTAGRDAQHALTVTGREVQEALAALEPAADVAPALARLLADVAAWEARIPTLRRRLREQTSTVAFAPPRLVLRALGDAGVILNGETVPDGAWRARVARDLLFCLLAHPQGLSREQIGALFWPEKPPNQIKLHLKKTLYRLRRVLGQSAVIFEDERYAFNRDLDYHYDVEAFWDQLEAARTAPDADARAAAYQATVEEYGGPYLPHLAETWVLAARERLWRAFVEAADSLAEHHLQQGEHERALALCRRVLAEDPCQEHAHRTAMRIHAARGNRAAVVRQYRRCEQALQEELNVAPSARTTELFEHLTA
jgi:ATP/maltotriose-dependent transcriptional regulator MalT/DNA-binding SARP family transcriptional activator